MLLKLFKYVEKCMLNISKVVHFKNFDRSTTVILKSLNNIDNNNILTINTIITPSEV